MYDKVMEFCMNVMDSFQNLEILEHKIKPNTADSNGNYVITIITL